MTETRTEPESFTGYRCIHCPAWSTEIDEARSHCICPVDGCEESRYVNRTYRVHCPAHEKARTEEREAAALAAMEFIDMAKVPDCEMFLLANDYTWGDDPELLAELFLDQHDDASLTLDDVVIHPCRKGTAGTSDIAERIFEEWAEQYDDDSTYDWAPDALPIPADVQGAITDLQVELEKHAPVMYTPITQFRIQLTPSKDTP